MIDMVKKIYKEGKYACIYQNNNSKFMFGKIIAFNSCFVLISLLLPNGSNDGVVCIQTSNIDRIEINSKYCERMRKLVKNPANFLEGEIFDEDVICSVIRKAQVLKRIIAIELIDSGNDDITGFVQEYDDEYCAIIQIDSYGKYDGMVYLRLDDITQLSCDTQNEQIIFKLWANNIKTYESCRFEGFLDALKQLHTQNRYACIHTNFHDVNAFYYGKIIAYDKEYFAMHLLAEDGGYDGILVKNIQDILYIETDCQYVERMKKLSGRLTTNFISINSNNVIQSVLMIFLEKKSIIRIELSQSDDLLIGLLKSFDNGTCIMGVVNSDGYNDGECIFNLSDIVQLHGESQEDSIIYRLWQINYNNETC